MRVNMAAFKPSDIAGSTLLVVEDEPLIALDIASIFEQAGAAVKTANTMKDAMVLAEQDGLSAAVIDHSLVDGDTTELRQKLARLDIPFILYSGFDCPVSEAGGVHVRKPATAEVLLDALMALFHADRSNKIS